VDSIFSKRQKKPTAGSAVGFTLRCYVGKGLQMRELA
jgi:hypothetical protein